MENQIHTQVLSLMKSVTVKGDKAKFRIVKCNNDILIVKMILTKRTLASPSFNLIKKFKDYRLYRESISLKPETLKSISALI